MKKNSINFLLSLKFSKSSSVSCTTSFCFFSITECFLSLIIRVTVFSSLPSELRTVLISSTLFTIFNQKYYETAQNVQRKELHYSFKYPVWSNDSTHRNTLAIAVNRWKVVLVHQRCRPRFLGIICRICIQEQHILELKT